MLLLFHSLYILCVRLLKLHRNKRLLREIAETRRDIEEEVNRHTTTTLDAELNLKFDPPVYKQRYEAVLKILLDDRWSSCIHKIVDFGCAEFGLFYLIRTLYGLTEVLEVDIDETLLREYLFRLQPRTVDFINRRPLPLTVKVYAGSVAEPNPILKDVDVVVAVELIEHLYPDVLDAFPYNIFCYIHPKLVVVTTPNADFNVFFNNFNKFRHYDHKFEWSREQFQAWANNITSRFPIYTVSFIGIGSPPEGATDRGFCSQMALFVRQDPEDNFNCESRQLSRNTRSVYTADSKEVNSLNDICGDCVKEPNFGICTYYSYSEQTIAYERSDDDSGGCYKLIETIEYPYEERDPEEVVMYDVLYKVSILGQVNGRYYSYDKDRAEVPLQQLTEWHSDGPFISESELRTILEKAGYRVEECTMNDGENPVLCVIYEPVMENSSPPNTESDLSDFHGNDNYQSQEISHLLDWDAPAEDENSSVDLREAIKLQASEVIGGVFNDLETNQIESQDKPIETKVKFVMTKVMEAGTSHNDTKMIKKHKDLKTEIILQNTSSKVATTSKESSAGTSRKRKKSKRSDEDEVAEDVKELTECILKNSLNKVDDVAPVQAPQVVDEIHVQIIEEAPIVENGDLANNNRDVEGNNCAAEADGVNNENVAVENNEPAEVIRNEDYQNRNEEPPNQAHEEENRKFEDESDDDDDIELTFASREALFDPNSKEDLLEDFEIPPSPIAEASQILIDRRVEDDMHGPFDVVLLGVSLNRNEEQPPEPFPLWLLHLLGAEVLLDNDHTEPHFYCQGDGLGVHPSVVEVDVETSSSDSSNNSNDDAESEHTALESETVSLPEESDNIGVQGAVQVTEPLTESQTNTKESDDQANGKENDNEINRKESDSLDEFFDSKEEEQPSTSKGA